MVPWIETTLQPMFWAKTILLWCTEGWSSISATPRLSGTWEKGQCLYFKNYGMRSILRVLLTASALWTELETTSSVQSILSCIVINHLPIRAYGVSKGSKPWQTPARVKEVLFVVQKPTKSIKNGSSTMVWKNKRLIGINLQIRKKNRSASPTAWKWTQEQEISSFSTAEPSTAIWSQSRKFWEFAPISVCFPLTTSQRRLRLWENLEWRTREYPATTQEMASRHLRLNRNTWPTEKDSLNYKKKWTIMNLMKKPSCSSDLFVIPKPLLHHSTKSDKVRLQCQHLTKKFFSPFLIFSWSTGYISVLPIHCSHSAYHFPASGIKVVSSKYRLLPASSVLNRYLSC